MVEVINKTIWSLDDHVELLWVMSMIQKTRPESPKHPTETNTASYNGGELDDGCGVKGEMEKWRNGDIH